VLNNIFYIRYFKVIERLHTIDKVIFINRNKQRNAIILNKIILILQAILSSTYSILKFYNLILKNKYKFFLEKSIKLKVSFIALDVYLFIYLNRKYNNEQDIEKTYFDN